ncbi:hypothetical protein BC829DRAFT_405447 [Chytridium lagenaria]|nr:hypothetical protein BC829DRAFT_405447 [Chytridium lagenaria]
MMTTVMHMGFVTLLAASMITTGRAEVRVANLVDRAIQEPPLMPDEIRLWDQQGQAFLYAAGNMSRHSHLGKREAQGESPATIITSVGGESQETASPVPAPPPTPTVIETATNNPSPPVNSPVVTVAPTVAAPSPTVSGSPAAVASPASGGVSGYELSRAAVSAGGFAWPAEVPLVDDPYGSGGVFTFTPGRSGNFLQYWGPVI